MIGNGSTRGRIFAALTLAALLTGAGAAADRIGPLAPGMTQQQVIDLLGPPAAVDPEPQPGCADEPATEFWDYSSRGLILTLARADDALRLTSISSFGAQGPALFHNAAADAAAEVLQSHSLAIGDGVERIRAVLPEAGDADGPILELERAGQTLSISLSGMEPRQVTRIELTDAPARTYDEGDPCP